MKYELILDNEWYYEGTYEQVWAMADGCADDDEMHSIEIVSEEEFYNGKN